MLELKEEPKDLYKEFKLYEKCIFCAKETALWHMETNTPVCWNCSRLKTIEDVKAIKKTL